MYTSDWYSWEDRNKFYRILQPGDILQQKIESSGLFSVLPQMEHWALFLGVNAENQQPLIVHVVNDGSSSGASSSPAASSLGSASGGGLLASIGLSSNAPLVFSGGSSVASAGSASLSPIVTLSSGCLLVGGELAAGGTGGLILLCGGGMISSGAASSLSSSSRQSSSSSQSSSVRWNWFEEIWTKGKEFRKHNFKDREWTAAPFCTMLERVYSEYKAARPYSLMKYNCEQFAHYCRYGKRYSGQVAAFSKDVKWWTLGLVKVYDEFD